MYKLLQDDRGQDIAEYAVMLALIIVACIAAITALGANANATFSSVAHAISTAGS